MANRTIRYFFAPSAANVAIGPNTINADTHFELKPALIMMVQASPFYGCLHQNLGRRTRELEASKIVSIKESIAWGSISADSDGTLESALFEWRQQIMIMSYGWRREIYIGLYKKGKIRVQVILR